MGTRIQGRKRMEKTKKLQRKSNIELLRALLMFLVIILHYNNAEMGGAFAVASGASLNVLKFIGDCSYSIYLSHYILIPILGNAIKI